MIAHSFHSTENSFAEYLLLLVSISSGTGGGLRFGLLELNVAFTVDVLLSISCWSSPLFKPVFSMAMARTVISLSGGFILLLGLIGKT